MANSKYEYVKKFELDDRLLPECWIVVRVDGKGFTKFSERHGFEKPNDKRALDLMNDAAKEVMREFADVCIAFGESDEFSFVFHKSTAAYGRRSSKLISLVASCFAGAYVRFWPERLPGVALHSTPVFDGRCVCYPSVTTIRDYLSWRQVDTHVNNQYNTCFWALVKRGGKTPAEAQATLKGTLADFKNELLFRDYGINYNDLPEQFRKGSVLVWRKVEYDANRTDPKTGAPVVRSRRELAVLHQDLVRDAFWRDNLAGFQLE